MILGLRTAIYHVPDLARAKAWYTQAFGVQPYFDEAFYVGFSIGGYELGLDPNVAERAAGPGGAVAYWGVADVERAVADFVRLGAKVIAPLARDGPCDAREPHERHGDDALAARLQRIISVPGPNRSRPA